MPTADAARRGLALALPPHDYLNHIPQTICVKACAPPPLARPQCIAKASTAVWILCTCTLQITGREGALMLATTLKACPWRC